MTAPQVGDTVTAEFLPLWENKGGANHTVTGVVWQPALWNRPLMIGTSPLAAAVRVDVVETAS